MEFQEAAKLKIVVEGFSSAGDTRCLKGMKIFSNFPDQNASNELSPYFQVTNLFVYVLVIE